MTPEEKKKRYLILKHRIASIVRGTIKSKDGEVIQGERSVEIQVADKHKKQPPTQDYDAYSPKPKQSAEETEEELDREFGGDYFRVEPAKHRGTYKVVSNVDDDGWADYTKPSEPVPKIKIGQTNYTTLQFELKKAIRTLKNKKYAYRHEKEKNKIKRINSTLTLRKSIANINNPYKNKKNMKGQKWI